jgi:preprotein translocase subunit SecD
MGVDTESVLKEETRRQSESLKQNLTDEKIGFTNVSVEPDGLTMIVELNNIADADAVKKLRDKSYPFLQDMKTDGNKLHFKLLETQAEVTKKRALDQAIEVLRNRIDEFGVAEPSITAQGTDRILIQLPLTDLSEVGRAKDLISRAARLEFMMVSAKLQSAQLETMIKKVQTDGQYSLDKMKYSEYMARVNKDLASQLPANTKVFFSRDEKVKELKDHAIPYLLETGNNLGGESLKDANVGFGQYGDPEVHLSFSPSGAKKFEDLTGNNIGRLMAIVLDDIVYSAPSIHTKIAGGSAVITLGGGRDHQGMMSEANMISMALRAGSLPARLEQLEERTVGPSLGADSIAKAKKAALIGGIVIITFMIYWYRGFGVLATVGLMINISLLLTLLTALEATLTLPGIAGMALTAGMSVDANVLINERIKEELARGVTLAAAISEGYRKAFSAIFDSNVTTACVAIILFYYGTGPVRGFAVSLLIGMVTSMFAAIFVSRTILEWMVHRMKVQHISIRAGG